MAHLRREAAKWFRRAAEQGLANSQNKLGLMYEQGEGVPRDYVLAYVWFSLAAAQDFPAAANRERVAAHIARAALRKLLSSIPWLRPAVSLPPRGARGNSAMRCEPQFRRQRALNAGSLLEGADIATAGRIAGDHAGLDVADEQRQIRSDQAARVSGAHDLIEEQTFGIVEA